WRHCVLSHSVAGPERRGDATAQRTSAAVARSDPLYPGDTGATKRRADSRLERGTSASRAAAPSPPGAEGPARRRRKIQLPRALLRGTASAAATPRATPTTTSPQPDRFIGRLGNHNHASRCRARRAFPPTAGFVLGSHGRGTTVVHALAFPPE